MRTTTTQQSISEWEREENDGDCARRTSPSHLPRLPPPKQQSTDDGDPRECNGQAGMNKKGKGR